MQNYLHLHDMIGEAEYFNPHTKPEQRQRWILAYFVTLPSKVDREPLHQNCLMDFKFNTKESI